MQKFTITDIIPFPRAEVYATQRDKLSELAEYLHDISEIVVEEREETGSVVKFVNLWRAEGQDVPKLARSFIKPEMLKWHDYATWDGDEWTCEWHIKLGFLPDAIEASGKNRWKEHGDKTRVIIDGQIAVHADRIPGIPKMMAKKVGATVEKFVVKMIEPNLKKTNEGVTQFLKDHS